MKNDYVIGVLGGMGTYATIHLFKQYAEIFPAKKEWDRPRIVIDNRCTMPSRVRAYLYNENVDQLIDEMTDSMQNLVKIGCNRIILACNTSHLFLQKIYDNAPELEDRVVNIINVCVEKLSNEGIHETYLLGTEGTIDSGVYHIALQNKGIKCCSPTNDEYYIIRDCIEAVKRNDYTNDIKKKFLKLINRHDTCILGCTELPILYESYTESITCKNVYDPLFIALTKIRNEFEERTL